MPVARDHLMFVHFNVQMHNVNGHKDNLMRSAKQYLTEHTNRGFTGSCQGCSGSDKLNGSGKVELIGRGPLEGVISAGQQIGQWNSGEDGSFRGLLT